MKQATINIKKFLSSRRFFVLIMAFFIFEAAWIALSAVYPQAFDEDFHFGLIKVYSHYWLPFLNRQPAGANAFGAVARDPSYLYHYLMSFPYRVIALFVHNQIGQVIFLRFINIGLFATGLVFFRRVLLKVGVSVPLTNVSLLLFVLIPIAPQLAAQINYDNLLIPLVGLVCLLTFKVTDQIRKQQPSVTYLLTLLSVCLLTSLVQYEFMPIFLAVILFLLFVTFQSFRGKFNELFSKLWRNWLTRPLRLKVILLCFLIVSMGLFVQRDGVNLITYHTIAPDCGAVLSVQDCKAYNVWIHDYNDHQLLISAGVKVNSNPIYYFEQWVYWDWYRLFFAVNGPVSSYTNYPPLPLPSVAFALVAIAGTFAVFKWRRKVFKNPYMEFLALATAIYLVALMADGFLKYKYTGELELMNGRYLLPILLLIAALAGSALSIAMRKTSYILKECIAIVVILFFLQGGGFLTFIARSDSTWDWNNTAVVKANNAVRRITDPVIINGQKTYSTSVWFFN